MSLADLLAVVLGFSLSAYAVFAGADFGAGILDLLAGHRDADRAAISATIGPVWEANHVWLIFSITILFSAFPLAFSAVGTALLAPLTIALLAIVVRGAALGVHASSEEHTPADALLGRLFGVGSLIAPIAFGMVAGGIAASSAARDAPAPGAAGVPAIPWTGLFALVVGLLAAALCAELAAGFMTLRLARSGQRELAERFRRRGLQAGTGVLVLSATGLAVAAWRTPALSHRLTGAALPLVVVGFVAAVVSLLAFARRRYAPARLSTMCTGGALVWGWLVAQSPNLVGPRLTIHSAAAPSPALTAVAIAGGIVLACVLPALFVLFVLFARQSPEVTP